jgi:hypothetical protein
VNQVQQARFDRAFPISSLGWLNCDAFSAAQMVYTTIITDSIGQRNENTHADLRVIIKSRKSVIQSNPIGERTKTSIYIPKNEVSVVVALKVENGDASMAIVECVGQEGQTVKLDFQKMTPQEIREKLNFLNR